MQHSPHIRAMVYERLRKPLMSQIAPLQQVASDVQSAAEHSGIVEKGTAISPQQSLNPGLKMKFGKVSGNSRSKASLCPG
jgi:hypothetical protein